MWFRIDIAHLIGVYISLCEIVWGIHFSGPIKNVVRIFLDFLLNVWEIVLFPVLFKDFPHLMCVDIVTLLTSIKV